MFDTKSPDTVVAELAERLRSLRLQRNITQAHLARQAGVSRPTLSALESRGRGTVETLVRVMYSLGRERELDALLAPDPPSTLEDLDEPTRQRARPRRPADAPGRRELR